ncbi:MAG: permease-like cell division protein FtsX, partial [Lachnospiraceae bacterium]
MAKINAFIYSFKQGINNIWRNKIFSMASIATMAACIFLFGLFFAIVENFQTMVKEAESGVAVTVFFEKKLPQEKIEEIGNKIKKRVEVSKIVYVSPEEAWEEYKEVYFKSKEALAEGFTEDNPLANAANYQIYLNDVSMQESLVTYLESMEGVRQVNKSEAVANTLSDFNRLIGYISAGIIIILLFVAIFLISNTITVGIGVRREEIAIMKLIGATDYFVRAPFVVEGIVIGLLGSVIPLILLYSMYGNIIAYIGENFSFLTKILNFLPAAEVFKTLTPVALLLGVGIGFLGSRLTIRKH